jgi:predicted MFS family arabinose efflux permease/pimeloyl-ACP methyl ester carboxylesterase
MTTTIPDETTAATSPKFAPQIACLLIFVALVDSQLVASIAPQIALGLDARETAVAAGVTIYSVFAALVALGLAWSPRVDAPARRLPIAATLIAVASLITAAAPNVAVLYAGRATAGVACGLISALAIASLANASTYEKRGSQMSWVAIAYFLSPVLGVPLGAVLVGMLGWRSIFLLSAVAAAGAGLLVRLNPLPERSHGASPTPDTDARGARAALGRLWGLANRSASTRMGIVSAFFISGGLVGFTSFLGIWLHDAFGAGPERVALAFAIAGVGAVAGGAIGGKFADRFGKRRVALAATTAMWLLLPIVPGFVWGVPLLALIAAAAFAASLRVAPMQALVTELVAPDERPAYIALRNSASQLGIAAAVIASTALYPRLGMMGVALACAALTIVSWLTIRWVREPGAAAARRRHFAVRATRTIAFVLVLLLVALPWFLSFLVTKARTRPDERNRPETPATYGATFEEVSFASSDGNVLTGWYLPSTSAGTTIVMTHGLFRSRFELIERGCDLWRLGYGVVFYDLRRHGSSAAEFSTIGYDERHDVAAAVQLARERAPGDRIVLFGVSMGAAATLLAAAETEDVTAVVADSSFLSLSHTVSHHLERARIPTVPFAPMLVWMTAGRMGFNPNDFDVRAAVERIRCPILFIGGGQDDRMPIATVLDPLARASRNPLSSRFVVEEAGHGHAYDADRIGYIAAVNAFLHSAGAGARVP